MHFSSIYGNIFAMENNATYYRDYCDQAEGMIVGLGKGVLPHVGDLRYMHGASVAGRIQAERVMEWIVSDPELASQFEAVIAADEQARAASH